MKRNRQEYYERLQRIRDEDDWEGWLKFFPQGVAEVSGEATETARKILANELDKKLVGIGVLEEMTGRRRNRAFRYAEYIELFA